MRDQHPQVCILSRKKISSAIWRAEGYIISKNKTLLASHFSQDINVIINVLINFAK